MASEVTSCWERTTIVAHAHTPLAKGKIHHRLRRLRDEKSRVAHDTDDFIRARTIVEQHVRDKMLADRVFIGKEVVRQQLADHDFIGFIKALLIGEYAPTQEWNLHRSEVSWIAKAPARDLHLPFGQRRMFGNPDYVVTTISLAGNNIHHCGGRHPWKRAEAGQQLVEKLDALRSFGIVRFGKTEAHGENVVGYATMSAERNLS